MPTPQLKNTLVTVNNILTKLPQILSFSPTRIPNIVSASVQVSSQHYDDNDVKHTSALLNHFIDHAKQDNHTRITYETSIENHGIIHIRAYEKHVENLPKLFKEQHESLANALQEPRPFSSSHFSFRFLKITRNENNFINGLNEAFSALFEAGLGFPVSVTWNPMIHIENLHRTPGLLTAHKNNFLLFHPDYAFHPDYQGDKEGISSVSEDAIKTSSASIISPVKNAASLQKQKSEEVNENPLQHKPLKSF